MANSVGTPGKSIGLVLVVLVVAVAGWLVLGVIGSKAQKRFGNEEEAAAPLGPPGPTLDAVQVNSGKALFGATCLTCHGPAGLGVQGLGKNMVTSKFIRGLTDKELVSFIRRGRPIKDPANTTGVEMPPKGNNPTLTDDQLMDIVQFIRGLQDPRRVPAEAAGPSVAPATPAAPEVAKPAATEPAKPATPAVEPAKPTTPPAPTKPSGG